MADPDFDLATHPKKFCKPEELAGYWGVNVETIRNWLRIGKLRGAKLGLGWRIRTADAMQEASLRSNEQLAQILSAELHREFWPAGIAIASVDVVQRGRVVPLRVMKDWGTFEGRAL